MRVTRQKLIDLARQECDLRSEDGDVVAGFLTGSVAQGEPLLAGTGDIDLVLIHHEPPVQAREVKPLSEAIHLDITHHPAAFYDQPRALRLDPWWGPAIAEPVFLHDPSHFFEVAQAGARGQFFRPDNVHARARALLAGSQRRLEEVRTGVAWRGPYLLSLCEAANSAASLAGAPAAGRRVWLILEHRLQAVDQPKLLEQCIALLGGVGIYSQLTAWIRSWAIGFDSLDGRRPACLHPARRAYWLGGFQTLLEAGRPEAVIWPLLRLWTRTVESLQAMEMDNADRTDYEAAMAACGLSPQAQATRSAQLEAFVDQVDECLESWASRNGV